MSVGGHLDHNMFRSITNYIHNIRHKKCALIFTISRLISMLDEMSIRFAPQSVIPTNEDFLKDNSSETCTTFGGSDNEPGLQHTQLRIRSFPIDVGDINITITGSNLGCGHNLYVSPLSPVKSEQWIGRWTACELENRTIYGEKEICSYWCKSPGHCKETQILKVPKNIKESQWEICQITISANTTGEYKSRIAR